MTNPVNFAFAVNFNNSFNVTGPSIGLLSEGIDANPVWLAGAEATSNGLIHADQPLDITAKWSVDGALAGIIGGDYTVTAYFENVAVPASTVVLPGTTPHIQTTASQPYSVVINCPANGLTPGLYRLVISITMKATSGLPLPVAGFGEIGLIQVFAA